MLIFEFLSFILLGKLLNNFFFYNVDLCKNYKCLFLCIGCEVEDGVVVCKCFFICIVDYCFVCGIDGKIYSNMCGLEVIVCMIRYFKLGVKYLGECKFVEEVLIFCFFLVNLFIYSVVCFFGFVLKWCD